MFTGRVLWTLNTFILLMGYDDLSANKNASHYNINLSCGRTCFATYAVDRNISTCTGTDIGITAPDQYTWWYVDLGAVHSVRNIRIQFKDYGQEHGCSALNVYGCEKPCPDNCHENKCETTNGTCVGCTPGWIGEYCRQACPAGYYGLKCESECVGRCNDSVGCNHTSGLCDNGCDDGWTGSNCDKACPPKSYGPDCIKMCGHCSGDVTCNRTTGKCDTGCKPGYTGELCDTGCENGKFGIDCSNHCSGNCLAKDNCNSTNGHCDNGCASGYLEAFCNKTCDKGTYGRDCMQNCSINCMDGLCNNVNGSCICAIGKKGSADCNESM